MTASTEPKSTLTAWERWELASFDPEVKKVTAPSIEAPTLSAEEIVQIRETARKEGFAEGREAGQTKGHAEGLKKGEAVAIAQGEKEAAKLAQLVTELDQRITELNDTVAQDLVALSIELARKVVRETVAVRPEVLLTVVREALSQMPLQHASIHLNPEDASLARSRAGDQLAHAGHRIHEDPQLARGDVVIESGGSHLDATLATRWQRAISALGQDAPWVEAANKPAEKE